MTDPGKRNSTVLTEGPSRAAARLYLRSVLLTVLVAWLGTASLLAQTAPGSTATPIPAAPLPALLSHTERIFLANAGDQQNADCLAAYNAFYAALQRTSRYTLVDDPAQADLVVELHYEIAIGEGKESNAPREFRIALIDPKTRILIWSLTERTNYAGLQRNRDKNLVSAVNALADDFASLVSAAPLPPSNKSKVHHD